MKIVHAAWALALVVSPLSLGCAGPREGALGAGDRPDFEPAEIKPGAGGNNGLDSAYYQANEEPLVDATEVALTAPFSNTVSSAVLATGLLSTEAGRTVFKYAVGCALPAGAQVSSGTATYTGKGYLSSTASWPVAALPAEARNDLLACVIAHVNSTVGVDILISGQPVVDDGGDHTDFDVDEALWLVRPSVTGDMEYHVWPLAPFMAACEADPWDALDERICGQDPQGCNFIARHDLKTACSFSSIKGTWTCDGTAALMTTLKSPDVGILHPVCVPTLP